MKQKITAKIEPERNCALQLRNQGNSLGAVALLERLDRNIRFRIGNGHCRSSDDINGFLLRMGGEKGTGNQITLSGGKSI